MEPTIFHFNCPFCGAHPREAPLSGFLDRWRSCSLSDFEDLVRCYVAIMGDIAETAKPKRLAKAVGRVLAAFRDFDSRLVGDAAGFNTQSFDCPLCSTPAGPPPPDRYFTDWARACKVQIANVLYEGNLVLFAILRSLPAWASGPMLSKLAQIVRLNYEALVAVGLIECSYCGRHSNGIYGSGTKDNPYRCRWCLDRTTGGGLSVEVDQEAITQLLLEGANLESRLDDVIQINTPGSIPSRLPDDIVPFRDAQPKLRGS